MAKKKLVPDYKIDLSKDATTNGGTIANIYDSIKDSEKSFYSQLTRLKNKSENNSITLADVARGFIRKDVDDSVAGELSFSKSIKSDNYSQGDLGSGWKMSKDEFGRGTLDIDNINVRNELITKILTYDKIQSAGGTIILSAAWAELTRVEEVDENTINHKIICYYIPEGNFGQMWREEDIIKLQSGTNKYLMSYVESVSNTPDAETGEYSFTIYHGGIANQIGESIPAVGDTLVQFGCLDSSLPERQNIILMSVGDAANTFPYIEQYAQVNSLELSGKLITRISDEVYFGAGDQSKYLWWNQGGTGEFLLKGTLNQSPSGDKTPPPVWRGDYSSVTPYYAGDLVMYNGNTYIANQNSTNEIGNVLYWTLYTSAGTGVESVTQQFHISTSKTVQPVEGSVGWVNVQPTWSIGSYLWNRIKIVYKDPPSTVYTGYSVSTEWEAINSIEIGGRNLLDNSTFNAGLQGWRQHKPLNPAIIVEGYGGNKAMYVNATDPIDPIWAGLYSYPIFLEAISYTVSIKIKLISRTYETNDSFIAVGWGDQGQRNIKYEMLGKPLGEWLTVSLKFYGDATSRVFYVTATEYEVIIGDIMLEKGNIPSDWSPSPKDIQAEIDEANNYIDAVNTELQKQIDGVVDSWFYDYVPTTGNYPANEWDTLEEKERHVGDTFTNTQKYVDEDTTPHAGESWRWLEVSVGSDTYHWKSIADSDAVRALLEASKAQITADGKRRVFTTQPTNSEDYDIGDLWVNATYGAQYTDDLLMCTTAKAKGVSFNINHWQKASKYTDDTKVDELEIGAVNLINDSQNGVNHGSNSPNYGRKQNFYEGYSSLERVAPFQGTYLSTFTSTFFDAKIGELYTTSVDVRTTATDEPVTGEPVNMSFGGVSFILQPSDKWTRIKATLPASITGANRMIGFIIMDLPVGQELFFRNYKVEKGTKATAWTPSTDDVQKQIEEAQDAAQAAQDDANDANNKLTQWASDGYIDPSEKQSVKTLWNEIQIEVPKIEAQASIYDVDLIGYLQSHDDLLNYLSQSGVIANITVASPVDREDFEYAFSLYYSERQLVLNDIAQKAKDFVGESIDGIVIGGRNLLLASHEPKAGNSYHVADFVAVRDFVVGEQLTVSIRGSIAGTKLFGIWFNSSMLAVTDIKHIRGNLYSKTFNVPIGTSTRQVGIYLAGNNANTDSWTFESIKLEVGNKATDWTPAIEDSIGLISATKTVRYSKWKAGNYYFAGNVDDGGVGNNPLRYLDYVTNNRTDSAIGAYECKSYHLANTGNEPKTGTPPVEWANTTYFPAIASDLALLNEAVIGGFRFSRSYDESGNLIPASSQELRTTDSPTTPAIRLAGDGSGHFAKGNISWDVDGDLLVKGDLEAAGGNFKALSDGTFDVNFSTYVDSYDSFGNTVPVQQTIKINNTDGLIQARSIGDGAAYMTSQGIYANKAGIQAAPAESGIEIKAAVAALGFGDLKASAYQGLNALCGVYGIAINNATNPAPTYGGYFIKLKANGFYANVKKVYNSSSYTLAGNDYFVSCYNDTSNITINLPPSPQDGQQIIIKLMYNKKVTINGNGKSLFRNSVLTTITLNDSGTEQGRACTFIWDGSYWNMLINAL